MPNAPRGTIVPSPDGFTPNALGNYRPKRRTAPQAMEAPAYRLDLPDVRPEPQRQMRPHPLTLALLAGLASIGRV